MWTREKRRKLVIRGGKYFLRWLGRFQGRHSKIPVTPVLGNEAFDWISRLESATPAIQHELEGVLRNPEDIPAFHQLSPDQKKISKEDHWKTFALMVFGQPVADNCAQCPQTSEVINGIKGVQNAFFSILAPRYHIPPHKGPTRALVRCHLALEVPQQADQCWLRVDNERCHWQEGEVLLFDDTYEHEVYNNTDERRVVLFMDIDRPMDWLGTVVNGVLLRLLKMSTYVKTPMRNLARWNRDKAAGTEPS